MKTVGIYIQDTTTSEYNRVDLFDDEKISVTSSIQNINDIAKTYTDFSQTFTVPASKQNNKIFKHWYDNSNDIPFSTLVKSNAYIEIDTIPFRKGKIQLESANVIDGQAQDYSITFIGILGNLKDTFAGKFLKDLNLNTTYDFVYTPDEVLSKVTGDGVSEDVMFPLISSKRLWGYGDGNGATNNIANEDYPIRYNELFPAIRLRAVLNMIETQFGINFDGTIEEPSTFLTDARFTNAYLYLNNADEFVFKPTYDIITFQNTSGLTNYGSNPINLFNVPPLVNNQIYTNNLSVSTFYQRYVKLTVTPTSADIIYTVKIFENNYLISTQQKISIIGSQIFTEVRVDRNSVIKFEITPTSSMTFNASVLLRSENNQTFPDSEVTQTLSKSSNQTLLVPKLAIKEYFPEIKIEDFFAGLLKMFNLTCYSTDGINYTVEQLESYYGAGSDIDITKYVLQDKKALNRVKTYKKINFEYEKSESFVNVAFNSANNIEYGTLRYINNPPTEGEEYTIKLPFEDLNFSNLNALLQVGYCLKTDYLNYNPKPIILYDYNSANATTAPEFFWSNLLDATGVAFTKYKAFGQETLISGETYSLNFPPQQSTLTNEIVTNGLYQQYYEQYFANIYNYKARLIKLSAILPTSVLTTLKLNDSIIIRDAKYLINTYTTDLTTGLVQFELLTDERVREVQVVPGSVLYLDAGNPLSYPGTGTLWTDLSGNGNNGTLVNNPTFDPANGGSIVFDGVNEYALISPISNISYCTYSLWLKWGESEKNNGIFGNEIAGSLNALGIRQRNANNYILSPGGGQNPIVTSTSNLSTYSNWHNITSIINGSKAQIYINGILNTEVNYTGQNTSNNNFYIGALYNLSETFMGNISSIQIYNRALSSTEVLANFNATKGRYGL